MHSSEGTGQSQDRQDRPSVSPPWPQAEEGMDCPRFTRVLQITGQLPSRGGGKGFFVYVLRHQELGVSSIFQIHIHPESWEESLFGNKVFAWKS